MKKIFIGTAIAFVALTALVVIVVATTSTAKPVAGVSTDQYIVITTTGQPVPEPTATEAAAVPVTSEAAPEFPPQVEQARSSAQSYLSFTAFSRNGLIRQLSSSAGEGFPKDVATQAVDSLSVDWNAQASKSAESYLGFTSFSCSGLIQQLSSTAGEGFTKAQATFGAHQTTACK